MFFRLYLCFFFFSSRRRHTRCALVTGVQTCALPISRQGSDPGGRVMAIGLAHYLTVAAVLFTLGIFGSFLNRKTVIIILMSIDLMLLAVHTNRVAFSTHLGDRVGRAFAMLCLTGSAAEAAIGIATRYIYYRPRGATPAT